MTEAFTPETGDACAMKALTHEQKLRLTAVELALQLVGNDSAAHSDPAKLIDSAAQIYAWVSDGTFGGSLRTDGAEQVDAIDA